MSYSDLDERSTYYKDILFPKTQIIFKGKISLNQAHCNELKNLIETIIIQSINGIDKDRVNEDCFSDSSVGTEPAEGDTSFYYDGTLIIYQEGIYNPYDKRWNMPEDIEFDNANYETLVRNGINRLINKKLPNIEIKYIEPPFFGKTEWRIDRF